MRTNLPKIELLKFCPFFLALSFVSLYINQAPHNLVMSLFLVFGALCFFQNKSSFLEFYGSHAFFFKSLFAYFLAYTLINFYHFGFGADFIYSLKRLRWLLYVFFIGPTIVLSLKQITLWHTRALKGTTLTLLLIALLICLDTLHRFQLFSYCTSCWFTSSGNNAFVGRAGWTYNPIPFSKISFFLSLCFLWLAQIQSNLKMKALFFMMSASLFAVTMTTMTRAAWLGVLAAACVLVFFQKKLQSTLAFFIALALLTGFLFLQKDNLLTKRFMSIFETTSYSNTYRLEHWKANLKLAQNNPLLGVGYAANRKPEVISPYLKVFAQDKPIYGHPHNEYIDVLSGVGLPTFLIFLFILGYPLWTLVSLKSLSFSHKILMVYLVFIYFTAAFDKITLTSWTSILLTWMLIFHFKDAEGSKLGQPH